MRKILLAITPRRSIQNDYLSVASRWHKDENREHTLSMELNIHS